MSSLSSSSHSSSFSKSSQRYNDSSASSSDSMGTGSTPYKNRVANMVDHTNASTMNTALRNDFIGHTYHDLSVTDFVENVWGLAPETTQSILASPLALDQTLLNDYVKVVSSSTALETQLHDPFRKLSWQLLKDICDTLKHPYSVLQTCFWDKNGTQPIPRRIQGERLTRKPDMLEIFIPRDAEENLLLDPATVKVSDYDQHISWGEARCAVEFKRVRRNGHTSAQRKGNSGNKSSSKPRKGTPQPSNLGSRPRSTSLLDGPSASNETSSSLGSSLVSDIGKIVPSFQQVHGQSNSAFSDQFSSSDAAYSSQIGFLASGASAKSHGKRSSSAAFDSTDYPSKKTKPDPPTTRPAGQLGGYALETLVPGMRYYTTGILIDCFWVTVWYYDRTAVMHTLEFNFNTPEGIQSLALILFALSQATMKQVGFDPNLYKFIPPDGNHAIIRPENIVALDRPATKINNSGLCFKFQSTDGKTDHIFPVHDVISQYRGVVGRGTLVTAVKSGVVGQVLSNVTRVLKLSWQYSARVHEGELISRLRTAIPHWQKHLPDPIFYAKLSSEKLGLPRSKMQDVLRNLLGADRINISERDLHVLVTSRYKKLWKARNVDEFKRVFLDCLECHYHAYNTGRILHRDISDNNLMIYRPDEAEGDNATHKTDSTDAEVHEQEPSRGILNDFDMASILDDDGNINHGTPQHHLTGTFPFMARELVDKKSTVPHHYYRYDLESFFYLLIWAAIHYSLESQTRRITPDDCPLLAWKDMKGDAAFSAKSSLYIDRLEEHRIPGWEGIWEEWIEPLHDMFKSGQTKVDAAIRSNNRAARVPGSKPSDFNFETCDGHLTFQTFMDAIGATPRGLVPKDKL